MGWFSIIFLFKITDIHIWEIDFFVENKYSKIIKFSLQKNWIRNDLISYNFNLHIINNQLLFKIRYVVFYVIFHK